MANNKTGSSPSQQFMGFSEVKADTIILNSGSIISVVAVASTNFALKDQEEQNGVDEFEEGQLNLESPRLQRVDYFPDAVHAPIPEEENASIPEEEEEIQGPDFDFESEEESVQQESQLRVRDEAELDEEGIRELIKNAPKAPDRELNESPIKSNVKRDEIELS